MVEISWSALREMLVTAAEEGARNINPPEEIADSLMVNVEE